MVCFFLMVRTLPETNSKFASENGPKRSKRKGDRIPTIHFSGAMAVSFREGNCWFISPVVWYDYFLGALGWISVLRTVSFEIMVHWQCSNPKLQSVFMSS